MDDGHAIGHRLGLGHLVGGQQHRHASGTLLADELSDRDATVEIDAGGRLVEEQDPRLADQGQCQAEPLLLATGETAPRGVGLSLEIESAEQRGWLQGVVIVRGIEPECLGGRHDRVDPALLEHDADRADQLAVLGNGIESEDGDGSLVGSPVPLKGLDGGGLARAVGTQEGEHLSVAHVEIEVVDGGLVSVAHDESGDADGSVHGPHATDWLEANYYPWPVIDLHKVRADPKAIAQALARRGVSADEVEHIVELDLVHRSLLQRQEALRSEVKALSKEVGQARKAGDDEKASALADQSRSVGDEEREAAAEAEMAGTALRQALLVLPNIPSKDAPDGAGPDDNLEIKRWWPGQVDGAPEPTYAEHQKVPHWEVGEQLGLLDMERGARLAGSMFPLYRGVGARLLRALGAFALDAHGDAYEEIRPPTFALTETLLSTGHLPKFSDEAYQMERDDLWAIPTAEVPLTSMHRGEIVPEAVLPIRFTAQTACFRREAGAAGRDTRGLLRVHEFDKVELFAYTTPAQARAAHLDILERAEGLLQALGLHYRVLDLCTGDLGASSARTFDLEVYAPGCERWLEVSSVSWFSDYQARRAQVRFRPAAGGSPELCHTVNGSALAWARIWAAVVEQGRQADGSVVLPEVLSPYLGGTLVIPCP